MNIMNVLRIFRYPLVTFLFRLVLAGVFLWAGILKAMDPKSFALEIARYRILPLDLVHITAITLPFVEIVIGGTLLIGLFARPGAALAALLMAVFMAALASALYRGLDISCGCFGSGEEASRISTTTLLRDLLFLSLAIHVALFDRGFLGLDGIRAQHGKVSSQLSHQTGIEISPKGAS